MKKYANRLRKALDASHAQATRLDEADFPLDELNTVQNWQRERLEDTYLDLAEQQQYTAAVDFFLTELYGGLHFRQRDQEMERVLPVMVKMLREDMLLALAEAFELQALSLDLDIDMALALRDSRWDDLDVDRYGAIYRTCGRLKEREHQIDLIRRLGLKLNELVHHRLVLLLIRTLRGPARVAGFGLLQNFLEKGLYAFRVMRDGDEFVETIWQREHQAWRHLKAGHEQPFA